MISSLFYHAKRLGDANPILLASWVMGITAISLPFVVVPIRSALGFNTNHYTKTSQASRRESQLTSGFSVFLEDKVDAMPIAATDE